VTNPRIRTNGYAMQLPRHDGRPGRRISGPDYGRFQVHYRSAAGLGIRLDAGSATRAGRQRPFYDSMLVRSPRGRKTLPKAAAHGMDAVAARGSESRLSKTKHSVPVEKPSMTIRRFLRPVGSDDAMIDTDAELFRI